MADADPEHKEGSEQSGSPVIDKSGPAPVPTSSWSPSTTEPRQSGDAANAAALNTEGKSPGYFATLDASVEALQIRAQSLIDKINEKRSKDQIMIKDFNVNLTLKVTNLSQCLEERMYQEYEQNNNQLQAKLQEFTEVMERIGLLQEELKQVCQTLIPVYKDLGLQPDM
ncbi:synaptonemal complex central element protein 2 [Pyxicephalus adspersus]|uniref:Synaptonemal complex central element protein 2 n=1 Tax=Pyxicephalus adspersus TaxID=30357 RepID=A0AAV3AWK4_PYXAD|nr:TPA: hypothetical protein GDO54_006055 [Pyxicephalus adspersus]DBA30018.1 TPA: hypothetical protein GDO54_006055 [Pyxicephalus adspersus]